MIAVLIPSLAVMSLLWIALAGVASAQPTPPGSPSAQNGQPADPPLRPSIGRRLRERRHREAAGFSSLCQMIESAAGERLAYEFFAQVIWRESRLRSDAVGPLTRSGKRAQGIAQFMPGTAAERRLHDPFDPVQALSKSAEFLRELRRNSAISGWRPPPTTRVRNASATGLRESDVPGWRRELCPQHNRARRGRLGGAGQIDLAAGKSDARPSAETTLLRKPAISRPTNDRQPRRLQGRKPATRVGRSARREPVETRALTIFRQLQASVRLSRNLRA